VNATSAKATKQPAPHRGLLALEQLLQQERVAVIALDGAALGEIAQKKADLMTALSGSVSAGERPQLLKLAARAEANLALINDAMNAIAESLGIRRESGTYDGRARMRQRVRACVGKAL
jgi:hypothetical protein